MKHYSYLVWHGPRHDVVTTYIPAANRDSLELMQRVSCDALGLLAVSLMSRNYSTGKFHMSDPYSWYYFIQKVH